MPPISPEHLTSEQRRVIAWPLEGTGYLEGPAATGKTTVGTFRLLELIEKGAAPDSILILVPQRRLGTPYRRRLSISSVHAGFPEIVTIAGLARRMVELFWPLIAEPAGFRNPYQEPRFLTLETAQYHMSRVIGPYLDQGYFESLSVDRYRLYRQILDNINKAAVVGFPVSQIGERLSEAWVGPAEYTRIYEQAQHCAELFRAECYENNLVDFSLQYELFFDHAQSLPDFDRYFTATFEHMIVDNVEEETPRGHDFIEKELPSLRSGLLIADRGGGYSRFLGADPEGARRLGCEFEKSISFERSFMMSEAVEHFSIQLDQSIRGEKVSSVEGFKHAVTIRSHEYLPDLLEWIASEVERLLSEGVQSSQIAIVSPFVSDSLRFVLTGKLENRSIPWISHRPSRAIADEAFNRCLLTLAALNHHDWGITPSNANVAHALMTAIEGLDLVRATLLAMTLYRVSGGVPELSTFDQLRPEMQGRIGFQIGQKYEILKDWISRASELPEGHLDYYFSRLFGEVLSQPGFGFHNQLEAGRATAAMISSIHKFRATIDNNPDPEESAGKTYYRLIHEGLLAAQHLVDEHTILDDAVFIAPAFTYLSIDRRSDIQFWLDIGSPGWAERLYQPLTHPYVLSRNWHRGDKWTDAHENEIRREIASTITGGLLRRSRKKVYLCHSNYGEQGLEQGGILLQAIQRLLTKGLLAGDKSDV